MEGEVELVRLWFVLSAIIARICNNEQKNLYNEPFTASD